MSWNPTVVTVAGHVITDVVLRQVSDELRVASFRIASTERRFNREEQTWVDGEKLYLSVTCWRRLADNVSATLAKGDPVLVQGKLRLKYNDAGGDRRQFYEIEATSLGIDLSRVQTLGNAPEIIAPRTEAESVEAATAKEPEAVPF